jgi:multiple sugar transport system substrate-binding protein
MSIRKRIQVIALVFGLAVVFAACAPQTETIIQTVTVVETVETIIEGETIVETVEVIQTVEVEVTAQPEQPAEPGEDEVITITFWGDERGRDTTATRQLHFDLARAYEEANPNTKVAVSIFPSRGFGTRVLTAIGAGTGPDIWYHYYATDVAAQGFMENLSPYIEASGFDPAERWFEMGNLRGIYNGDYYAVPRDITAATIGYNKEIFDAAGVSYPEEGWTLADFRDAAIAITDADAGVYGLQSFDSGWFQWFPYPYNMGVEPPGFMSLDGQTIEGFMDSPEALEAYRWIMDLAVVDGVTAPKGVGEGFGMEALSGKVGMFILTTWERDLFLQEATFDYGVVGLPSWEAGGEHLAWADSYMYYLNSTSPHKQRAWDFLEWLSGPEAGQIIADSGVWTPALPEIWEGMGWQDDFYLGPIYTELQEDTVVLNYERSQFYWDCVGGIWDEIVGNYVDGGDTNLEGYVPELVSAGQVCLDENYESLE